MSQYRIPPQLSTAFVDLPSVEKSAPPALPSKKPSVPPPLLLKPAKPEPPQPTSLAEHKLPAPTTKQEPPKEISQSLTEENKSTGCFYMPVFKTGRIMVYQCPTVRPSVRPSVHPSVRLSVHLSVRPSVCLFHMSRSNLRTTWPTHFKFHRVIGIDGLTVCILYGEISNFHSRVMELYSSNCRLFFICRTVN